MTGSLLDAIDALIEANAALRKSRALAKQEKQLERAMRRAFLAQGRVFLARIARLEKRFPPELREVAESDWLPIFDSAALETVQAFQKPLSEITARALQSGMIGAVADLGIETAFTLEHPLAVEYLTEHGAELVTRINQTTRDQLRTLLTQAADEGWSYDKTARAIRARYADFSVKRARRIAIYELGDAYEAGTMVVGRDLQSAGLEMQKSWLTVGDDRVRAEHRGNQAQGWIPLDDAFQDGSERPPADPGCLPGNSRVLAQGIAATSERRYEGDLVILVTASDKHLACTPNHPVLTPHGWVGAGLLQEGGDVISSGGREWVRPVVDVDDDHMPATIHEVTRAFRRASKVTTRPVVTAPTFHGDGEGSKVAVIRTDGFLHDSRYATLRKHGLQSRLVTRIVNRLLLARFGGGALLLEGWSATNRGRVRLLDLALALFRRHLLPLQPLRFALATNRNAGFDQPTPNERAGKSELLSDPILGDAGFVQRDDLIGGSLATVAAHGDAGFAEPLEDERLRDIELARDLLHGAAGEVFADKIVRIDRVRFKGHVYNLETASGAYIANGIVTHNCRCTLLMRRKPSE